MTGWFLAGSYHAHSRLIYLFGQRIHKITHTAQSAAAAAFSNESKIGHLRNSIFVVLVAM